MNTKKSGWGAFFEKAVPLLFKMFVAGAIGVAEHERAKKHAMHRARSNGRRPIMVEPKKGDFDAVKRGW